MERHKDFSPTLFLASQEPTEYKTLDGQYVGPVNPGGYKRE